MTKSPASFPAQAFSVSFGGGYTVQTPGQMPTYITPQPSFQMPSVPTYQFQPYGEE